MTDPREGEAVYVLQVLGAVTLRRRHDAPETSLVTQPRHLAVLAWLAIARPRGLQARDALAALLWPEHDAGRSRRALRNAVHGLRRILGRDAILTAGDHLIGLNTGMVTCDAHALERGAWRPQAAAPEPLHGLHVSGAPAFEDWAMAERARLRGLIEHAPRDAVEPIATARSGGRAPDAHIMCARGHYLFLRAAHGGDFGELERAKAWFDRALAADPSHAPAVAGQSNYYAVAARRGWLSPFAEAFANAIALSERTVAMDATLATPHVHFGVKALWLDDAWERAGQEFRAAVSVEPDYAEAHRFLGVWLGLDGQRVEAVRAMEAAARLEPDIPQMLASLAAAQVAAGMTDDAEATLRTTLAIDRSHPAARDRLLRILEDAGRFEEAVAERMRSPAMRDAQRYAAAFERSAAEGYRDELRADLRTVADALEARVRGDVPPTVHDIFAPPAVALVATLVRLGDTRRARSWRLQAQAQRPALARWFAANEGDRAV